MGNYSWLIITTNGATLCAIDWDACDFDKIDQKNSEAYRITWLKDAEKEEGEKRPKTLQELAEKLHDQKLFGYLDNGYIEAFMELCRHMSFAGTALEGQRVFPRIYYEEEGWQRLHYFEFHPGTDLILWGTHSFNDEDIPKYPDPPPGELMTTQDQRDAYNKVEREAHLGMIDTGKWLIRPLKPSHEEPSAAITLMALFGIRPEDPDAIERASKVFDVKWAMRVPSSELFGHYT